MNTLIGNKIKEHQMTPTPWKQLHYLFLSRFCLNILKRVL